MPQVYSDVTIELRGNLTIARGGSLTLRGVTLVMNGERDGDRRITVRRGGALAADVSPLTGRRTEIRRRAGGGRFAFEALRGARVQLVGALVSGAGWDDANPGLVLAGEGGPPTRDVAIFDCEFHDNYVGATLRSFSQAVLLSSFHDNLRAGIVLDRSSAGLEGVRLRRQPIGVWVRGPARPRFDSLEVEENGLGLFSQDAEPEITYSLFGGNDRHAIFDGPGHPTIQDSFFVAAPGTAVEVSGGAAPSFGHDDFAGNGFALRNSNPPGLPALDARDDFWGAGDGPSGEGPGSGDPVGEDVDFAPWCERSCVRSRGIASGASS
jgi:hypothetical protein